MEIKLKLSNNDQIENTNISSLKIGAFLQIRLKESKTMMKAVFVGKKKDEYFVITRSESPESSNVMLSPEKEIIARHLYNNRVYEFKSKIIKIISNPVELVLLDWPGSCHLRELRSIKRINCSVSTSVELKSETEAKGLSGVIKDINKNGCRCLFIFSDTIKNTFKNDEELLLTFAFPGTNGVQEVFGHIKNIQTAEDKVSINVGIEFSSHQWWAPPYQ